jgi:hypothetical protein
MHTFPRMVNATKLNLTRTAYISDCIDVDGDDVLYFLKTNKIHTTSFAVFELVITSNFKDVNDHANNKK